LMTDTPRHVPRLLHRLIDFVWLLLLSLFVLAGVPLATFHGDESMQIYMSKDYTTAFIDHTPERLLTSPPYNIDSDQQLRILNGSVNRYTIGLSWQLAGLGIRDLPPAPGWDWGLSYTRGVETGHRPDESGLLAGRLPSALFLCGSVVALFGLGWLVGGRGTAYIASALYTLNPIILLNGRRAMQEGSLLCFGLFVVLLAAVISRKRARGDSVSAGWWAAFVLAGGLALASKHSSIVFIGGAFAWILAAELVARRKLFAVLWRLALSGALMAAMFVALSPALWNNPLTRFQDLLGVRQQLIDIQIAIDPIAPTTLPQRVSDVITQPFIAPPMHYELPSWGEDETIRAEIAHYMASPLSGVQFGLLIGVPLMLLAGIGIIAAIIKREPSHIGLLAWLVVTIASLLVNPLPWQRYFLPLIPAVALCCGLGLTALSQPFSGYPRHSSVDPDNPAVRINRR
jgi:hypothetical protein